LEHNTLSATDSEIRPPELGESLHLRLIASKYKHHFDNSVSSHMSGSV
jgi:hypothetical protein